MTLNGIRVVRASDIDPLAPRRRVGWLGGWATAVLDEIVPVFKGSCGAFDSAQAAAERTREPFCCVRRHTTDNTWSLTAVWRSRELLPESTEARWAKEFMWEVVAGGACESAMGDCFTETTAIGFTKKEHAQLVGATIGELWMSNPNGVHRALDALVPGWKTRPRIAAADDNVDSWRSQESREMRKALVRFFERDGQRAVWTNADNASDFLLSAALQLDAILPDAGDERRADMLADYVTQVTEIAAKLKGYKADVYEERVIIAGKWRPEEDAEVIAPIGAEASQPA